MQLGIPKGLFEEVPDCQVLGCLAEDNQACLCFPHKDRVLLSSLTKKGAREKQLLDIPASVSGRELKQILGNRSSAANALLLWSQSPGARNSQLRIVVSVFEGPAHSKVF